MRRMKTRVGRSRTVAPTPLALSTDAASSSATSQRKGGVPSQRNQFTRKYEAQWKDDLKCKFVKVLIFFFNKNYNIIYEVITI